MSQGSLDQAIQLLQEVPFFSKLLDPPFGSQLRKRCPVLDGQLVT